MVVAAVVLLLLITPALAQNHKPSTKVVLLGTGTPRPFPDRSGPATAIVVDDRAYLVDFGAGVVRRAAAGADRGIRALAPENLKVAFVTHLHTDHTIGYPDLIFTSWMMGRESLSVYGPEGTEEMTRNVLAAWRRDTEIRTTGDERRRKPPQVTARDITPGAVYKDDLVTVTAFPVRHGAWKQAFGYRFATPDRVIVISGDTSPSEEIVKQCNSCDVLIHETYSPTSVVPQMPDWKSYRAKYHTSTSELAAIATRAKPKLLVVYHIAGRGPSGRIPDEQVLREVQERYRGPVVIGKDLDVY